METINEVEVDKDFDDEIREIREIEDPTKDSLHILCKGIKKRLRKKFDLVMAISGDDTGIGKSSLGIHIGKGIQEDFNLKTNIAYLPREEEIRKKFNAVPTYGCFDVDEAIKSFYKLNWMDKMQKMLNQDFMTNRKENYKCTQLLIPNFTDLNSCFRNYKVKLNIYIPFRGIGILYVKFKLPFDIDPWNINENNKIMKEAMGKYRSSELGEDKTIDILTRPKNFAGIIYFDRLSKDVEKEYIKIFNEEKIREEQEGSLVNETGPARFAQLAFARLAHHYIDNHRIQVTEIARICKVGQPWVSKKLGILKKEYLNDSEDNNSGESG
jgi:hypothetical protein